MRRAVSLLALMAALGSTPAQAATPAQALLLNGGAGGSYTGLVATRLGVPTFLATGTKYWNASTGHVATTPISLVTVCFTNFYFNSPTTGAESAVGAPTTMTATVEYPVGTIDARLTFGGSNTGSIPDGRVLCSDPTRLPVTIPVGPTFNIRMWGNNTAGGVFTQVRNAGMNDNVNNSGTVLPDLTGGGTITNTVGNLGIVPIVIAGPTTATSLIIMGDSQDSGFDQTHTDYLFGYIEKAIPASIPFVNISSTGETATNWPTNSIARQQVLKFGHNFITDLGSNDIHTLSKTSTTLKPLVETVLAEVTSAVPNALITYTTMLTEVPSTDGHTTVANQGIDGFAAQVNAWNALIAGGSIIGNNDGYFDIVPILQTSNKWNISATARTASDCAMTAGQNLMNSASLAFVSTDIGQGIFVAGAAAGGANFLGFAVGVVNSGTQVTTLTPTANANASTTVSAASCKIGAITWEGTHFNNYAVNLLVTSGVVDTTKFHYP